MDTPRPMPLAAPVQEAVAAAPPAPLPAAAPAVPRVRLADSTNVLLVEELDKVAGRIAEQLGEHEDIKLVETVTDGAGAMQRILETQPDVIMIDVLLQGSVNGLQLANQVREAGITTPILLLTVPKMPVTLNEKMGIAHVLQLPLKSDVLSRSITQMDLAHRGPAAAKPAGTFVVFSGKGGVGRTTIAHQLATSMSGRRGARVALVDGDVFHGDLRLLLDAPDDAPSIVHLPSDAVGQHELRDVIWTSPSGIDVLLAPLEMEQADLIGPQDFTNILTELRKAYDAVVIDAPTAVDERTLVMLDHADVVIDVVSPDPGVLRKARRYQRAFEAAAMPMDKYLSVLNHADASGASAAEVSAELGRQIVATVPEHPVTDRAGVSKPVAWPAIDHLASVVVDHVEDAETASAAAA